LIPKILRYSFIQAQCREAGSPPARGFGIRGFGEKLQNVAKLCKTYTKCCQIFKNLAHLIEKLVDLAGVRAIIRTYKDGHLAVDRRGGLEHMSEAQTRKHTAFHVKLVSEG